MLKDSPAFSGFSVDDTEAARAFYAVERYEGTPMATDEKGVFRGGGPLIAWFTDPAGNVLSLIAQD